MVSTDVRGEKVACFDAVYGTSHAAFDTVCPPAMAAIRSEARGLAMTRYARYGRISASRGRLRVQPLSRPRIADREAHEVLPRF